MIIISMDHIKPLPLLPHVNIVNDPEYRTECTTHLRYKTKSQNGYGTFPKVYIQEISVLRVQNGYN